MPGCRITLACFPVHLLRLKTSPRSGIVTCCDHHNPNTFAKRCGLQQFPHRSRFEKHVLDFANYESSWSHTWLRGESFQLRANNTIPHTYTLRRTLENPSMRRVLTLAIAVAITGVMTPASAEAGLFDCFKKRSSCCPDPCCEPAPSCCAPVATCCAPEPTCCTLPAPTCCAPAPTCCEPEPCCAPDPCATKCRLPRLSKLKNLFKRRRSHCCPEPCCEPAPSCCAPAAPSCCAPAMPAPCCGG